jgi:hypothetical protein
MTATIHPIRWYHRLLRRLAGPRKPPAPSIRRPWSAAARKSVAISIINAERKGALRDER